MNYLFRIPAWLFSLLLSIGLLPFALLLYTELPYDLVNFSFFQLLLLQEVFPLLLMSAMLLSHIWLFGILLQYLKNGPGYFLLILPAVFGFIFWALFFPFAIRALGFGNLIAPLVTVTEGIILFAGTSTCLIAGITCLLLTRLFAAYAVIKMTSSGLWDTLQICATIMFLPVGIFWLQPRLRNHFSFTSNPQIKDHLVG